MGNNYTFSFETDSYVLARYKEREASSFSKDQQKQK